MGAVDAAARTQSESLHDPTIEQLRIASYTIPTDAPESDGTLEWHATTLIAVHAEGAGRRGFGYTYGDRATAALIEGTLAPIVRGRGIFDIAARWHEMARALRNAGRPGIGAMAMSAIDIALWDLKAKLLGTPLVDLLGAARDRIPAYGSGGFTSYSHEQLTAQLGAWAEAGLRFVKMKVGREPNDDPARVRAARRAIGNGAQLFVDANGAYGRKQALAMAESFAANGVAWFEEPVSSDDLDGLRLLRDRAPAGMDIAAGEYGYDAIYFRRMLAAGAVDVLQADATRCGGVTGFLDAAALCSSYGLPLSSHCAPSLHLPLCCSVRPAIHLEYFHDHARIEEMLFDGFRRPQDGLLSPDRSRAGLGVELKTPDAERFRA